jgi:Cu/Ag efflux pump CusA
VGSGARSAEAVFYAITSIITAYLPMFSLEQVERRLFRPMAWTVTFALLGALMFSILVAPVLATLLFRIELRDWANPVLGWINKGYCHPLSCKASSGMLSWRDIFLLPRTKEAIGKIRLLSPSGERVSLAQLCKIQMTDGPSALYREANSRYVAIEYSVRGRDLGGTVEEAIDKVNERVKLPPRYSIEWAGEYQSQQRSEVTLLVIVPMTIFLIFLIIYTPFGSAKWACLHLVNLAVSGTHFSISSGVGVLALFGTSVQTGVIMVEYINQLRAQGRSIDNAAIEGAVRRLRPILMTMLVATLGLLPAALSHAIGSDSQRPFAIVIVGGLIVDLIMITFLLPTFYVWWARPADYLPSPE